MKNLGASPRLELVWDAEKSADSLRIIYNYVLGLTESSINWYMEAKTAKRIFARAFRVASIVLGSAAALLPTLGELVSKDGVSQIKAGWAVVCLGIVAALLLLDRFFGFSTGWMRYVSTGLQLRQMEQELKIDWAMEEATWEGEQPNQLQIQAALARLKAHLTQVNTVVRSETNTWIKEFENVLRQIDESTEAKSKAGEPGSLNLVVENGDQAAEGWMLSIDDGNPEKCHGKTASRKNLTAGSHKIRIEGLVSTKTMRAEKVVIVPAGAICEVSMVLE